MRLDKYLKVARIIKRRTIASDACKAGRIKLNGRTAKAGSEVKIGDIIEVRFGEKIYKYEVLNINEHAGKSEAASLYRAIEQGDN